MSGLDPDTLTWTGLLAQWMDFARASVALPPGAEGDRWRDSIAPIITLQAVTFALAELGRLSAEARPLARDKAEVLIRDSESQLATIWKDTMTETVREICTDARTALRASLSAP